MVKKYLLFMLIGLFLVPFVLADECTVVVKKGDTFIADGKEFEVVDIFEDASKIRVSDGVVEKTIDEDEEKSFGQGLKVEYEGITEESGEEIEISIDAEYCVKTSGGVPEATGQIDDAIELHPESITRSRGPFALGSGTITAYEYDEKCMVCSYIREDCDEMDEDDEARSGCFTKWKDCVTSKCRLREKEKCSVTCRKQYERCGDEIEECEEFLDLCKRCFVPSVAASVRQEDQCPAVDFCSRVFRECDETEMEKGRHDCKKRFERCSKECTYDMKELPVTANCIAKCEVEVKKDCIEKPTPTLTAAHPRYSRECEEKVEECKERCFREAKEIAVSEVGLERACSRDECSVKNNCVPIGYRTFEEYCDIGGLGEQKGSGEFCSNNFECESNSCLDSECTEPGFWQKIFKRFSGFFGVTGQAFGF